MGNNASRNETRNARSSRKQLAKNSSGAAVDCESATRGDVHKQTTTHYQVSNSAGLTAAGRGPVEVEQQSYQQQQQRSRQQSNWSLGSLSGRLNWSFTGATKSSFRNRNKTSIRKSFNSLQQKRSKTIWHRPLTNAIFSSHFKEISRNEHFHIDSLIAKGAFGVVFKVIDKQQQEEQQQLEHSRLHNINAYNNSEHIVYALKVLKKSKIIEDNSVQQIKDEADIQKLCGHHPFIVRQFDLWQNRRNLHILSEYVLNGELFSKIVSFSIDLIRLYVAEIALAIDFLHNAGIIYRDAKPENILLNETYHIKLTDFGLSKWLKLGSTTKTMCGTFQYMAPEILRGEPYGHAVDWWSLGIITCQMFTDRSPDVKHFLNATFAPHEKYFVHPDVTDKSMQNMPNLTLTSSSAISPSFLPPEVESLPHAAKDVIKRLLEIDAKQRLRSVRALQRIALYQNYKIDSKHLLSIAPLDIISKDNIRISNQNLYYNDEASVKAIKDFQNF